jgi:hypothetical protein
MGKAKPSESVSIPYPTPLRPGQPLHPNKLSAVVRFHFHGMASLEVDHFQDLFLGYDPPSKEMPFVGAYFRKSPIHKEVHILTLVLSEGQELNMTPTPSQHSSAFLSRG